MVPLPLGKGGRFYFCFIYACNLTVQIQSIEFLCNSNNEISVIRNAGHALYSENAEDFIKVVVSYLQRICSQTWHENKIKSITISNQICGFYIHKVEIVIIKNFFKEVNAVWRLANQRIL